MESPRMLEYRIVPVTPFQQNCSILVVFGHPPRGNRRPRRRHPEDRGRACRRGVTPEKILLTHGHIDHAGATAELARRLELPIEGPQLEERFWIDALPQQSKMFGFPACEQFEPDRWLEDGDEVTIGEERLAVLHCPGHTPGHVVFFSPAARLAVVGDVLFAVHRPHRLPARRSFGACRFDSREALAAGR